MTGTRELIEVYNELVNLTLSDVKRFQEEFKYQNVSEG